MSEERSSLFAYGSLQLPVIFEAVTGASQAGTPAVLKGYRRTCLQGFGFPAIFASSDANTPGVVYRSLGPEAWRRLDAFEDHFYECQKVSVRLENGVELGVSTYVLSARFRHLSLDVPWSLEMLDAETIRHLLSDI